MSYSNYNRHTGHASTAAQEATTNLDQDLKNSRNEKYVRSEKEVKNWVFKTLQLPQNHIQEYERLNYDLLDILQDGLLLCRLGTMLNLGEGNPCRKSKDSRMAFVQMENISFFLKACEMVGVPADEIFQTVDLYEKKDPYQIIVTLISFSRKAHINNPSLFKEVIGPKTAKVPPPVPTKPLSLRVNKS